MKNLNLSWKEKTNKAEEYLELAKGLDEIYKKDWKNYFDTYNKFNFIDININSIANYELFNKLLKENDYGERVITSVATLNDKIFEISAIVDGKGEVIANLEYSLNMYKIIEHGFSELKDDVINGKLRENIIVTDDEKFSLDNEGYTFKYINLTKGDEFKVETSDYLFTKLGITEEDLEEMSKMTAVGIDEYLCSIYNVNGLKAI